MKVEEVHVSRETIGFLAFSAIQAMFHVKPMFFSSSFRLHPSSFKSGLHPLTNLAYHSHPEKILLNHAISPNF
jgi:hypothetical protein